MLEGSPAAKGGPLLSSLGAPHLSKLRGAPGWVLLAAAIQKGTVRGPPKLRLYTAARGAPLLLRGPPNCSKTRGPPNGVFGSVGEELEREAAAFYLLFMYLVINK